MKSIYLLFLFAFALSSQVSAQETTKPNVVFIYADDMGYREIQSLNPERSKIPTPNLNQLAMEGMVFSDAHTSSVVFLHRGMLYLQDVTIGSPDCRRG